MAKRKNNTLERRLRKAADAVGLKDWQIILSDEPAEDCFASIEPDHTYRQAAIKVCEGFLSLPRVFQDEVIGHELAHIHVSSVREAYSQVPDLLAAVVGILLESRAAQAEENACTMLEKAMSKAIR